MIVAITGNVKKLATESFAEQYERVLAIIEKAVVDSGFRVSAVACGRKNGVDRAALLYAQRHQIPVKHFPLRFTLSQNSDALIALHDGSKNTTEVIDQMSREGKLVHVVRIPRS